MYIETKDFITWIKRELKAKPTNKPYEYIDGLNKNETCVMYIYCENDKICPVNRVKYAHSITKKSAIYEVKDNNAKPIIIKKEKDLPKDLDRNKRIGVLMAPIPLPKKVNLLKDKIKKIYNGDIIK